MDREWAIPILLGLLTATALWFVPHGDDGAAPGHDDPASFPAGSEDPAIVLPFRSGRADQGQALTFLLLAPDGRAAALAELERSPHAAQASALAWQGEKLAFLGLEAARIGCYTTTHGETGTVTCHDAAAPEPLPQAVAVDPADTGPRLLRDGFNATRLTVHVFDEMGLLAATNAPADDTEAFIGEARPQQLPAGVWYVGANATAPNGTRPVPGMARPLFDQLRPLMEGLPAGGVASVRSDAYASLYGPLYVTVRIDELVHAP